MTMQQNVKTKIGAIKWWSESKGYGFIGLDDGGEDIFANAQAFQDLAVIGFASPQPGQRVVIELDAEQAQRGPIAKNVFPYRSSR